MHSPNYPRVEEGGIMEITKMAIENSWIITHPTFSDNRGIFSEWFHKSELMNAIGVNFEPQQVNISQSKLGVIRGIHFSTSKIGQSKIVTCVSGSIQDVIVDVNPESKTFGKYTSVELSEDSFSSVLIGPGLGHAFLCISEFATVAYLLNSEYDPTTEFSINAFDPEINIEWKIAGSHSNMSLKDSAAPNLKDFHSMRKSKKIYPS